MSQQVKFGAISWREWSEEAFLAAKQDKKPVLLTLTATWCHWCHVMDQTSYSDPQVINLINSRFIPVRVDVDRRPDISRRYNQGGFPSVVFLTGEGQLITGRVYIPPEEMVRLLEQVTTSYGNPGVEDHSPLVERPVGSTLQIASVAHGSPINPVVRRLKDLYDPEFGGFGSEPKQPPWEGLRLLIALYSRSGDRRLLDMVENTLKGMRSGIYDQNDQGFFRYSVARDWKVPHYEKMLVTNASLAVAYLEAYQVTKRKTYKETVTGILNYLFGTLFDADQGLLYASQDAEEHYYQLPWKDRNESETPPTDRVFYTGWNALAAESLLKASGVLGTPAYLRAGTQVLDHLWRENWTSDRGMAHMLGDSGNQPPVLADQVYCIRAFLTLYQTTGHQKHLRRAITVVRTVQRLFGSPDGGFYDIAEEKTPAWGMLPKEKSVLENSLLAEALISLARLTGECEYLGLARNALEAFAGVVPGSSYLGPDDSHRMEEDEEQLFLPAGAAWARAWDMLNRGPVHLVLVGDTSNSSTKRLWEAALKTYAPHRITQVLDPERDADRLASLGFPTERGDALYACIGDMCLAPITSSKDVRELERSRPWASR